MQWAFSSSSVVGRSCNRLCAVPIRAPSRGAHGIARGSCGFIPCTGSRIWFISCHLSSRASDRWDSRIVLSLLGLRFIDIQMNFMYLNAAWWYFSMLIQLYLIFPVLFWAARHLGPWKFLLIACAAGFFARYLLLAVWPQNGLWVLGGFAICRLPEFALGMSLAIWHTRSTAHVEWFLLRGPGFVLGLILYPVALQLYDGLYEYIFVDFATGTCCMLEIVGIAGIILLFKEPAK